MMYVNKYTKDFIHRPSFTLFIDDTSVPQKLKAKDPYCPLVAGSSKAQEPLQVKGRFKYQSISKVREKQSTNREQRSNARRQQGRTDGAGGGGSLFSRLCVMFVV